MLKVLNFTQTFAFDVPPGKFTAIGTEMFVSNIHWLGRDLPSFKTFLIIVLNQEIDVEGQTQCRDYKGREMAASYLIQYKFLTDAILQLQPTAHHSFLHSEDCCAGPEYY